MIFCARPFSEIRRRDLSAYTVRVRGLLICVVMMGVGCYRPRIEGACEVRCDVANAPACPSGLTCGADNLCYEDVECRELGVDAAIVPDAHSGDPSTCAGVGWLAETCPVVITPPRVLGSAINTETDCDEIFVNNCLIAAEAITMSGTFVVTGPRPLVVFARKSLTVAAGSVIDVLAGSGNGCAASTAGASTGVGSAATGGGPGGTLGGRGGYGGGASTNVKAMSVAATTITTFRPGCPGGNGGVGPSTLPAAGGAGGGAIYLVAGEMITIAGTLRAPGRGGAGATPQAGASAGGGGGGSGGMIVLDAPRILVQGALLAHGGGGGGGARDGTGGSGGAGTIVNGAAANGGLSAGTGSSAGGSGSGGSSLTGGTALDATAGGGAGGGGGGAGVIKMFSAMTPVIDNQVTVSPPAT